MTKKTVLIASDHAGFELKSYLLKTFPEVAWKDLGPANADSVDYPDYAAKLVDEMKPLLVKEPGTLGILICGSGQGMAIRANRASYVRAALVWNEEVTSLSRTHNDANVLCLPARFVAADLASKITKIFLSTAFEGGRHQRRVDKLNC